MKTTTITLTNDFHGSQIALRARNTVDGMYALSAGQVRRARSELCGMTGCTCGGDISERGWQEVHIELQPDGSAILWDRTGCMT